MSNKSEATWHPGTAPEVPHADLIARLRHHEASWSRISLSETCREAADALAALSDTVPRAQYEQMRADRFSEGWTAAHAHFSPQITTAERERDEARAERDALAHVIEQVREWMRTTPATQLDNPRWLELDGILDTAPAVSLARQAAEVKAQALDEFREEVLAQAGHIAESGYYSGVQSWPDSRASAYSTAIDEVEALATDRAAAIREETK